jgi:Response regulator containing a CheY-like receiver domain and an HTH DNA-binding domain
VRAMTQNPTGYERSTVALGMSRARIGEARGDADAVLDALEPVRRFPHRDATDEPGFWPWQDLYADALVAVGRVDEADTFLGPHEERAAQRGRRTTVARLARSRGRVEAAAGRTDRAEAAFARALAATEHLDVPFERARIELAAGQFLRRAGQRRRAADLLGAAERRFTVLGALPYAERCAKELAASGLKPTARLDRDRAELTAQELVVVRLAAAGRSNRKVADELVVSIKTIEYHLRNAFQKLGVSSRRQLSGRLAELDQG